LPGITQPSYAGHARAPASWPYARSVAMSWIAMGRIEMKCGARRRHHRL
jgi:hypothetical protein